jgi:Chalcone isomerase-like
MKTFAGFALLAVLGAAMSGAAAAAKESEKQKAHVVDGRPLVMMGQGARVKDGEKLYDMQMWIDEEDGRRAFPALAMRASGRDKAHLTRGDHGPAFLVWGRFTKQAVFKFAKAVPAATMRDEIKGAIDESVKGADAVAAMFAVDADAGDEWVLTTRDDGRIELRTGDGKDDRKEAPQSPKLERALWNVWLGAKPVSVELRRALIERLDTLGR